MGQVVELVFEGIDIGKARRLLSFVAERGRGSVEATVDGMPSEHIDGSRLAVPLKFASLSIRLREFRLGHNIVAPNATIRSFCYGAHFDVEVSFDLDDISSVGCFADALFDFAQRAAAAYGVEMYFAGLEPATDVDTRIFTTSSRGPFNLAGSRST